MFDNNNNGLLDCKPEQQNWTTNIADKRRLVLHVLVSTGRCLKRVFFKLTTELSLLSVLLLLYMEFEMVAKI